MLLQSVQMYGAFSSLPQSYSQDGVAEYMQVTAIRHYRHTLIACSVLSQQWNDFSQTASFVYIGRSR